MSHVVRHVLRIFFDRPYSFDDGILYHDGRSKFILRASRIQSTILDLKALAEQWCAKGCAGLKFCMFCSNCVQEVGGRSLAVRVRGYSQQNTQVAEDRTRSTQSLILACRCPTSSLLSIHICPQALHFCQINHSLIVARPCRDRLNFTFEHWLAFG